MALAKSSSSAGRWDLLYERAAAQAGYFTLGEALEAGFTPPLLHHHCGGRVERVARGVYRLRHFPLQAEDEFVPLWLWADRAGTFSHETALQLHDLSDALPARIHLTVPAAWRRRRLRVPAGLALHYGDLAEGEATWHGPIPITSPLRTLRDCATAHVQPDLLAMACQQAVARGLVSPDALEAGLQQEATP